MNQGRRCSIAIFSVAVVVAMSACLSAASAAPRSVTTRPAGNLDQYYGFARMEIIKLQYGLGEPIVADVNGDSLNDIIVANNSKARIELLLQKKGFDPDARVAVEIRDNDVNDVFGRERTWRFHRATYDLDVSASGLVVADLNGDRRLDLAYNTKEALYVALQRAPGRKVSTAKGKGPAAGGPDEPAWLTARRISVSGALQLPGALACGDLNGDKRTDLAVLGADGTFVILQSPDGAMGQPKKLYSSSRRARRLDIVDINADGRDDMIVLTVDRHFPLRVRFQTAGGKLGPEVRLALTLPLVMKPARLGRRNCLVTIAAHSGRVQVWALAQRKAKRACPVFTYPLPVAESAGKRDIVAADVDGDG